MTADQKRDAETWFRRRWARLIRVDLDVPGPWDDLADILKKDLSDLTKADKEWLKHFADDMAGQVNP